MPNEKPIGILFVHGIGNQKEGETLVNFSEPIFEWIDRWIKGNEEINTTDSNKDISGSYIQILDANIKSLDSSPAHMEWFLRLKQDDGENEKIREQKWLLAEAWWAESFEVATFSETLKWAFNVGPAMILLYINNLFFHIRNSWGNLFLWFQLLFINFPIYSMLSIISVILVDLLALILVLLSIFPIPSLRSFISSMQLVISNWIGDSYLLTTSPVRYAAMVSRVKHELKWLEDRCEKIVVVAHSQGAAIAHEVFQQHQSNSVQHLGLVTFGSGLKLLNTIKMNRKNKEFLAFNIASAYFGYIAMFYFLMMVANGEKVGAFLVVLSLGIPVFILSFYIPRYSVQMKSRFRSRKNFKWVDLYASKDPAPNGPLFDTDKTPQFLDSKEVYNYSNLITDHTTYWQNQDEFVAAVVCSIDDLTELGLSNLTKGDAERIEQARWRRKWRVRWLVGGRTVVMLSSLFILFFRYDNLYAIGNWIITRLGSLFNFLSNAKTFSERVGEIKAINLPIITGAIALLALPYLWYLLMRITWNWWESYDIEKFFRREKYDYGGTPFRMFVSLGIFWVAVLPNLVYQPLFDWLNANYDLVLPLILWVVILILFISVFRAWIGDKDTQHQQDVAVGCIQFALIGFLFSPVLTWFLIKFELYEIYYIASFSALAVALSFLYEKVIYVQRRKIFSSRLTEWLLRQSLKPSPATSKTDLN